MNPRERILTTMRHERPDRIPAVLTARPEVNRALMDHFRVSTMDDVNRILGTDGWAGVAVAMDDSRFLAKTNGVLEGDAPGAGRRYIFHEPGVFEDALGVVHRLGQDGKYVQWVSGPLVNADSPDGYDRFDLSRIRPEPDLAEKVARLKAKGCFVAAGVTMPFKLGWMLRGMEDFLCDYMVNPSFVERLYGKIAAFESEIARIVAAPGVDMLSISGDLAMQDRVIMGAANFRRFDKPVLAQIIRAAKAVNPGIHVFIHSDGDNTAIMDDLIEIGFDVVDPIQPECMDPVTVKQRWGRRITLHGCGSLQRSLPFGSPEDVRAEVRHVIDNCGQDGGLVLRVSNAIGFDCPLPNVLAFFETARDYRLA